MYLKHGYSRDPIYPIWTNMIARCNNSKKDHYDRYGGRGIKVCDEWYDISVFADWAYSNGYEKGLQIDRIDNDGNYCPSNCRFVTHTQNLRNTSINKYLTICGETKCLSEWAEDYGIHYKRLASWYERHGEESTIKYLTGDGAPDNRKKVYCEETDTIYPGVRATAKILGCDYKHVSDVCRGVNKTHRGYHFRFVKDGQS